MIDEEALRDLLVTVITMMVDKGICTTEEFRQLQDIVKKTKGGYGK